MFLQDFTVDKNIIQICLTENLNIFSKLFKMMSTVNDLKSNESSDILMKQNMNISFSVTTLMKTDHFSNLQQSYALESF